MFKDLSPLHPAIVHFPIALFLLAGLFGAVSIFIKRDFWRDMAVKSLIAGVIFSPLAIITGLVEEQNIAHNEAIHEIMVLHKFIGVAILFYYQGLLVWYWIRRKIIGNKEYITWAFCLLLGSLLTLYQGYLGGKMVFKEGAGVKPMESFMEPEAGHHHDGGKMEMNDSTDHKHAEESDHKMDNMKDMKGMNNTKDMKGMDNMKDMKGMNNTKDMKDMKGMNNTKDMKDMKGMNNTKDMKSMDNMKDMKGMDTMKNIKGMKGMEPGMNMKSNPMDTIRFPDNNPARKKSKKPVKQ